MYDAFAIFLTISSKKRLISYWDSHVHGLGEAGSWCLTPSIYVGYN